MNQPKSQFIREKNICSNSTCEYYTLNDFLTNHGSTWLLDNLQLYPFIVVGPLGFFLNTLALLVFRDKHEFKDISLYVYMRVYCLNSALLCLISTFNFCYSYRIFAGANTYWAQVWVNYFFKPISKGCYFYGGLLDIAILLDRIAFFNKRVKAFMTKISPTAMCSMALTFAVVIDCSYYFIWKPTSKTVMLNSTQAFTVWFTSNTEFANTKFGTLLTFAMFILTDAVIMVINLVLNMISAYYMRKHLGNKLRVTSLRLKMSPLTKVTSLAKLIQRGETIQAKNNINLSTMDSCSPETFPQLGVQPQTSRTEATEPLVVSNVRIKRQKSASDQLASRNLKSTFMVIFMCVLSIVEHLIMITCNYYIFYSLNFSTFALSAVANFVMTFKHSFNFIIFYSFNTNFKRVCRRFLGISKS